MQPSSTALRRATVIGACALAYLLLRHLYAAAVTLPRTIDVDESQYLHVGWLLAHGKRLYRDFVEDHSPFLFVILEWLVPTSVTPTMPRLDVIAYVSRARTVTSACGLMALISMGLVTYRATKNLVAPLFAIATLLGSNWLWYRGLTDVRNDPPTLFLFWLGVLLLIGGWQSERWKFVCAGTGIGLAAASALWNPKTPFECVILGTIYLWILKGALTRGPRAVALTIVPAVAIVGATVALIASTVSLSDYFFFTLRYNKIIGDWFGARTYLTENYFEDGRPFLFCDPAFKGVWPLLAIVAAMAILFVPAIRRRTQGLNFGIYAALVALAIAAVLDIRVIFPYPNLWSQYYLMWDFAMAALYGVTVAAIFQSLTSERLQAGLQILVAILAVFIVEQALPRSAGSPPWYARSYLQKKIKPGETVWVSADINPIGTDDASYYWFAFNDLVPASMQYSSAHPGQSPLPNVIEEELPTCRAERGLDSHVRFVTGGQSLDSLPVARQCLERMVAAGRAVQAPVNGVWDLHPQKSASGR